MSTDDFLARATRATRERTGGSVDVRRTRARVLATAVQGGKRRKLVTTLLPLAAVLAVSTAWADMHGWLRGGWNRSESDLRATSSAPAPRGATHNEIAQPLLLPVAPATPAPDTPPTISVDDLPRAPDPTPTPTPTSTSTSNQASNQISPPSSASSLYAAAHRAHFVTRDPASALAAWDAYLLAAPTGPFAPEARYNRALSLVRLGRRDEARDALEPFANGAYGSYRARDAKELLDALGE